MKAFQRFTVNDIIFLAILSAALTIVSGLTMPMVMMITLFGVRNMVAAAIYGVFIIIAFLKVRKPGALTIVGLFHGVILLMIVPVMFFAIVSGAIITEIVVLLIFRRYESEKSIVLASGLFIPFTLPGTILFSMMIHGTTFDQVVEQPLISGLICLATLVLSFIGVKIGLKIGKELQKAGKL